MAKTSIIEKCRELANDWRRITEDEHHLTACTLDQAADEIERLTRWSNLYVNNAMSQTEKFGNLLDEVLVAWLESEGNLIRGEYPDDRAQAMLDDLEKRLSGYRVKASMK